MVKIKLKTYVYGRNFAKLLCNFAEEDFGLAVSVWAVSNTGHFDLAVSVWGHFGHDISVHVY